MFGLELTLAQRTRGLAGLMFEMLDDPQYIVPGKHYAYTYTADDEGFRMSLIDKALTDDLSKAVTHQRLANERFVEVQIDGDDIIVGSAVFDAEGNYEPTGIGTRYAQEPHESGDAFVAEIVKDMFVYLTTGELPAAMMH